MGEVGIIGANVPRTDALPEERNYCGQCFSLSEFTNGSRQKCRLTAILRDSHKMVLNLINLMRPFSVCSLMSISLNERLYHTFLFAKAFRLKGEGLEPGKWKNKGGV